MNLGKRKEFNVGYFNPYSKNRTTIVERVQRTIKERMLRFFKRHNTYKYVDMLQDLTTRYNNIGRLSERLEKCSLHLVEPRARYRVGDYVKISRDPSKVFRKGYKMGWSVEVFTIDAILSRDKVIVHRLRDLNGEAIKGTFYEPELQKVRFNPRDDSYRIERIIQTRGRGANKEYLVKWVGYPDSFNSYIKAKDIVRI